VQFLIISLCSWQFIEQLCVVRLSSTFDCVTAALSFSFSLNIIISSVWFIKARAAPRKCQKERKYEDLLSAERWSRRVDGLKHVLQRYFLVGRFFFPLAEFGVRQQERWQLLAGRRVPGRRRHLPFTVRTTPTRTPYIRYSGLSDATGKLQRRAG